MTDSVLLEEKIMISGFKKKYLAEALGITPYGLMKKIANVNEFKASEISKLCELLNIKTLAEKERIFFANNADK